MRTKTKREDLIRDRQLQITDAAIAIFGTKGFHGATLREISLEAGFTQGTIYNYVETKEDILFLVCDRVITLCEASIQAAFARPIRSKAALRSAIRETCATMFEQSAAVGILYREAKHLSRDAEADIRARINLYLLQIEEKLRVVAGIDKEQDARFLCSLTSFLPAIFGLRPWALPSDMSPEEQIDQATHFICSGLGISAD